MAEWKHTTPSTPSSASMTSLGRALVSQQVKSDRRVSVAEVFEPERRGSDSHEVLHQFRVTWYQPKVEARVLVINTGGTIGMTYHNNGKLYQHRSHTWLICTTNTALQTRLWDYLLMSFTHFNTTKQWERFKIVGVHINPWLFGNNDNLKDKSTVVPNVFGRAKI